MATHCVVMIATFLVVCEVEMQRIFSPCAE